MVIKIKNKLYELEEIFENDEVIYHRGYNASELRKLFVKRQLPNFVDEDKLYTLIKQILDLSKEGLIERGYGEEVFLESLYERVKNRTNPAKDMLKKLGQDKSIEDIIDDYGRLK